MQRGLTVFACAALACSCSKRGGDRQSPGGAGDGATIATVVPSTGVGPVERGGRFVFSSGDLSLEIDPRVGGRVVTFSLEGRNFLTGTDADPQNYGSTLWTSPQSDWGWPPPPEIDNLPYSTSIFGKRLVLTSATSPKMGIAVTKMFAFDTASSSVTIEYVLTNRGPSARSLGPWEITRVHTGGLTLFPTGNATYDYGSKPLVTTQGSAMTWFKYDPAEITTDCKLFADGRGYLAHVDGRVVLVKKFVDVPPEQRAPKESEIEIYANRAHTYIEIENQGSYAPLAPQASVSWTVRWSLRKLPSDVDASVGSAPLARWVQAVAASL